MILGLLLLIGVEVKTFTIEVTVKDRKNVEWVIKDLDLSGSIESEGDSFKVQWEERTKSYKRINHAFWWLWKEMLKDVESKKGGK